MTKNTLRDKIYLAALLHDIGKFYQRADENLFSNGKKNNQTDIKDVSFALAQTICPANDYGKFGHHHVVWTSEFFERKSKLFKTLDLLQETFDPLKETDDNLINLSVNHHRPQTILQAIVTMADWWSAGIDRTAPATFEKEEGEDNQKIQWGKERYKKIPLYSIFNCIHNANFNNAFNLGGLGISKSEFNFPQNITNSTSSNNKDKYNELWNKFNVEFDRLPSDQINGFTESLLYLLKKYAWAIPSNTMDMANVSLFEHLKTTAAFADCIYAYYLEHENDFNWNNNDKRLTLNKGVFPVLLVGCDISGIQKFIYNISSSKAAQSLKGRSFYLQLLIDSIIQKIITHDEIQATIGHVIYSSGGVFYMLLPNNIEVINALAEIKNEIEKELWKDHKGKIFVNLSSVPFAFSTQNKSIDFVGNSEQTGNLGSLWKKLAEQLMKQKNQKFSSLLTNSFDEFFNPENYLLTTGGDVKVCAVTGEELNKASQIEIKKSGTFVSEAVIDQIKLGNSLKDADFLITYKDPNDESKYLNNTSCARMNVVGIDNYLFDQKELTKEDADFRRITSADVSRVKKFNNTSFLDAKIKGQKVSYGFQFYGGNKQAEFNKIPKTFEELTQINPGDEKNETYLGILRMDVDNLGNIFINGLPENQRTFAAYATLSFQLDLFFSGYLNTIREKYKDWVNILYSGGDDVFAIGRWKEIIEFAADIRTEFEKFVGRKDISISGGIAVVKNKYPIAKAAELAGEAENASKKFKNKNAITFLGETVSWELEYDTVVMYKNCFVDLITSQAHKISHSILHKLMQFASIQKNNVKMVAENPAFIPDLSYKWNTMYYLKRFRDRFHNDRDLTAFIKNLEISLFADNGRNYELVALAARWAELEIKFFNNLK